MLARPKGSKGSSNGLHFGNNRFSENFQRVFRSSWEVPDVLTEWKVPRISSPLAKASIFGKLKKRFLFVLKNDFKYLFWNKRNLINAKKKKLK